MPPACRLDMLSKLLSNSAVVILTVLCSACASENVRILELKDVGSFNAQEVKTSPKTIRITGLAFHSALGIWNITTSQHGDNLQVLVQLALADSAHSGNFDYTLTVPEPIRTVTFGEKEAVIWDRVSGMVERK